MKCMEQSRPRTGGLQIPPPFPFPYLWERVFNSQISSSSSTWMHPAHRFRFHHERVAIASQKPLVNKNYSRGNSESKVRDLPRETLVFNKTWLTQLREHRLTEGDQEIIEYTKETKHKRKTPSGGGP